MDIGTAKPTKSQQKAVKHHLIDLQLPSQPINVQQFHKEAISSLEKTFSKGDAGFLVGGSGLYLKTITSGLLPPSVKPQKFLRKQLENLGQKQCYKILRCSDPLSAEKIAPADLNRTQRALEVLFATGKSIKSQQYIQPPPWKIIELGLNPNNLKERIIHRTKTLYQNGLIEETELLVEKFGSDLPLLQTIGYKEALDVIQSNLNIDEAISVTTRRTNQFAKRQRTWFRNQHNPQWLNNEEPLREALSLIKASLG